MDAWRERNIGKREYSRAQSRTDFVLMKKEMLNNVKRIYNRRCNFSDHKYVILQMDFNDLERGAGLWHLNT